MNERTREAIVHCKAEVVPRLRSAVEATERGVLDTGAQLTKLVDHAVDQADELKSLLPLVESGEGQSGIDGAFERQRELVEAFVGEALEALRTQSSVSREAASMTDAIMRLASSISEIARNSQILTINAKIEAIRLGERGNAIKVIAEELSAVSRSVAKANEAVADTAARLVELLPALAEGAHGVQAKTERFSDEFSSHQGDTRAQIGELRDRLRVALERSDARSTEVVGLSRRALSSLQFQDAITQDLNDAEACFFDLAAALDVQLDEPPPLRRLGTELASSETQSPAGDVVLF